MNIINFTTGTILKCLGTENFVFSYCRPVTKVQYALLLVQLKRKKARFLSDCLEHILIVNIGGMQ